MLDILHGGLPGMSSHSLVLARELAIAATTAVRHNVKLAAQCLAAPDSLAESGAVIRGVLAASQNPSACFKMLHKGVLNHVAAIVSHCLGRIAAAAPGDGESGANHDSIQRKGIVVAAVRALNTLSRVKKLWRADTLQLSVAEFSSLLWSLLNSTNSFVTAMHGCAEQCQADNAMPCWHSELVEVILMEILHLAHSVMVQSRAWHVEQGVALNLSSTFWTSIIYLSSIQCRHFNEADAHRISCKRNALYQCLLCLPPECLHTSDSVLLSCDETASKPRLPAPRSSSSLTDISLWHLPLYNCAQKGTDETHVGKFVSEVQEGCSATNYQHVWYQKTAFEMCAAEHTVIRLFAWTMSALLRHAGSNTAQSPTAPPWQYFVGKLLSLRSDFCASCYHVSNCISPSIHVVCALQGRTGAAM
jgi:hypothetical protein